MDVIYIMVLGYLFNFITYNVIEEQDTIKLKILEALSKYEVDNLFKWKPRVYELLNIL